MYKVVFRTRFERLFKKLDKQTQKIILDEIETLASNPFTHPQIRKIAGVAQNAYRLRVGRWRVLYFILSQQQILEVVDLFMKKSRSDYHI
jgi:mRNA-degrading endonuclease RelE of RelBE toxin-antitoxin system